MMTPGVGMMTPGGGMTPESWLWLAAWIVGLLAMVGLLARGTRVRSTEQEALDILRARFARGEIDQDQFERTRDALQASSSATRQGVDR
jgi:putative membrane protein